MNQQTYSAQTMHFVRPQQLQHQNKITKKISNIKSNKQKETREIQPQQ